MAGVVVRFPSAWALSALVHLTGCADLDSDVITHCALLEQKAWFAAPSVLQWTVHQADDARVLSGVPTRALHVRWQIEEAWLDAVTEDEPPVVAASFPIEDHVAGEPDADEVCGVRSEPEAPWRDRELFRVDFSHSAAPPPGLFAADTDVLATALLPPAEPEAVVVHVGADGGVVPLSFLARPNPADDWSGVSVRLAWQP